MDDNNAQKLATRSNTKQSTSSAEPSPMNVTDFRSVMTAMMTDFKTEILSQLS